MVTRDQLAHDLAIVYLNNRHAADVSGEIDDGDGSVETTRLPAMDKIRYDRVPTGEKFLFGRFDKTRPVEAGFEVDSTLLEIIDEYFIARDRFYLLLESRHA